MKDLFVNFIGALVFSVVGFFYARGQGQQKSAAMNFVPSRKGAEQDYLTRAREKLEALKDRLDGDNDPS